MKKSIHGKRISKKEAYRGLGDPSKWEKTKQELMKDFRAKPPIVVKYRFEKGGSSSSYYYSNGSLPLCIMGVSKIFKVSGPSFTLTISNERFPKSKKGEYANDGFKFGKRKFSVLSVTESEFRRRFDIPYYYAGAESESFTFYYRVSK